MREILFRGKLESGAWVYGSLVQASDFVGIIERDEERYDYPYMDSTTGCIDGNACIVDPDTVGQYTGLTDKNGKKIFEGDIVKRCFNLTRGPRKETRETQVGVVRYDNVTCGYLIRGACNLRRQWPGDTIEVIGNVHDNPELMEVANE